MLDCFQGYGEELNLGKGKGSVGKNSILHRVAWEGLVEEVTSEGGGEIAMRIFEGRGFQAEEKPRAKAPTKDHACWAQKTTKRSGVKWAGGETGGRDVIRNHKWTDLQVGGTLALTLGGGVT